MADNKNGLSNDNERSVRERQRECFEWMMRYHDKFDEGFPNFAIRKTPEEFIEIIKECIRTGEKYRPYKNKHAQY